MGTWGVLAFDNDDANDWAAGFDEDTRDLSLVENALAAVESEGSGYLEQGIACEALAACEVLARLQVKGGLATPVLNPSSASCGTTRMAMSGWRR